MKNSMQSLIKMFPHFFDKSETSNFFKSQSVTNNLLKGIFQSISDVSDSLRLRKRCCIWKEQSVPYDYVINFVVNYPQLKSVKCYKNDTLLYMEEYLEEDNVNSFIYSYDSSEENTIVDENVEDNEEENEVEDSEIEIPIIPDDTFKIIAEAYDEIIIEKGFPENDELIGDIYDHDISLDEIGALNGIQRKTYKSTEDYAHTEPPYNNRLSEDDYHYMNRIIEYNLKIHNTPLPVLEIWKEYGIFSDMINREEYLLKMFDEQMHPYDEETGLVGEWTPQPWEHKDKLCNLQPDLGRFFFVSANTLLPVKNQAVKFNFKYLNSLAEHLTGDYNVTILLQGEEEDTVLVENYPGEQYTVDSELISDDEPNIFIFNAYYGNDLFATEELTVNVRGCNTADWYVSTSGDDDNTGKIDDPFATLDKALSMVNGEENLIILTSGTHSTDHIFNVPYTCTVLGCGDPIITSTDGLKFFRVYQNQSLNIQDITLTYDTSSSLIENSNWINNNKTNNPLYVILSEAAGKTLTTITLSTDYSTYTIGDTINITGTLKENEEDTGLSNKSVKIYVNNELIDTVTTLTGGSFSKSITASASGTVTIKAVFEADEDYAGSTGNASVTVNKKISTITFAANKASYDLGETISLTGTLKSGTTNIGSASVKIYDGETLLDTVTTDSSGAFTKTVSAVALGSKTYKAVFEGSSTYASVTSSDVTLTITKRTPTISLVTSSAAVTVGGSYTLSGALLYNSSGVGSAAIKIYNGATLVDTVNTANDGTFSKTITSSVAGTFTYKAIYEGDSTYANVESSTVNVVVSDAPAPASITLSCDKPIMMTGETATITATVLDENDNPCVGETVSFEVVDGEDLGTATTDSSGEASVYYLGKGPNLLYIQANCQGYSDETQIDDLEYYNPGNSVTSLIINSGVSCTSNGDYITITTSVNSEKYVYLPVTLTGNWEFETTLASIGTSNYLTFITSDGKYYGAVGSGGGFVHLNETNYTFSNLASVGDIWKVTYNNGVISFYINNVLIRSKSATITNINIGYYTIKDRVQHLKNIKLRKL